MSAKPLTIAQARRRGEIARDAGMDLAARRNGWLIQRDTLRFLDAMMNRVDRTATTDDATDDLAGPFADGGKWRGSIPLGLAREGLITRDGYLVSARPARHCGTVRRWKAVDLAGIERKQDELRRWLAEHPCPSEPVADSLFGTWAGEREVGDAL